MTKAWRSMGGWTFVRRPVVWAGRRSRRVAAWRSIRAPRPLSRTGPRSRCPVDGPAGRGRQRELDHLGALAAHARHPVAVLVAEVGEVGAGGVEDPRAEQAGQGRRREAAGAGACRAAGEQRLDLPVGEPQGG